MPVKKGYKHKYPQLGTRARIRALVAYREQYIRERGTLPVWTAACNRMGIRQRTILIHAPEIAERWYDTNFMGKHTNGKEKKPSQNRSQSANDPEDKRSSGISRTSP